MSTIVYNNTMSNLVIKGIDEGIKRRFRALCAMEGKSASQRVRELIQKEVEEKEKGGQNERRR